MREIAEGLHILMKYEPDGSCEGQHDIIYAAPRVKKGQVSSEDAKKLDDLGWHWSTDGDCWAVFT